MIFVYFLIGYFLIGFLGFLFIVANREHYLDDTSIITGFFIGIFWLPLVISFLLFEFSSKIPKGRGIILWRKK